MPTPRLVQSVEERPSGGVGMVGKLWSETAQQHEGRGGKQQPKLSLPELLEQESPLANVLAEETSGKGNCPKHKWHTGGGTK